MKVESGAVGVFIACVGENSKIVGDEKTVWETSYVRDVYAEIVTPASAGALLVRNGVSS
jgi:hypothetical protein